MTKPEWFAAHVLMILRAKDGTQEIYPVMENVFLIQAPDFDAAYRIAAERGRSEETDAEATQRLDDDRPAKWEFLGVRKVVSCDFDDDGEPGNGGEVTYSQFSVRGDENIKRLAEGGEAEVTYYD